MYQTNIIQTILAYFDFLVKPYEFKLHYDQKNGTICGGFVSIMISILLLFYFLKSITIQQKIDNQYFISYLDTTPNQEGHLKLTNKDITLAFFMSFNETDLSLEEQRRIVKELFISSTSSGVLSSGLDLRYNQKINGQVIAQNLNLIECSQQVEQNELITSAFPNLDSPIYCLAGDFLLQYQFYQNDYSYLSLFFDFQSLSDTLTNSVLQLNFISNEQIVQSQGDQIQMGTNLQIKQLRLEKYQKITYQQNYQVINLLKQERDVFSFSELSQVSEQGARIFSNVEKAIYSPNQMSVSIEIDINNQALVYLAQIKEVKMAIMNSLSLLGGLFTTIFTLASLIYKYYYLHRMYQTIMNETFVFDLGTVDSRFINKSSGKEDNYQTQNPIFKNFAFRVEYNFFYYTYQNLKFYILNFLQYFRNIKDVKINQQQRDLIIFENAQIEVKKNLDLRFITKKLYEIDKLKMLLLNNDQLSIFNHLVTPVIQVDEQVDLQKVQDILTQMTVEASPSAIEKPKRMTTQKQIDYIISEQQKQVKCQFFSPFFDLKDTSKLLQSYKNISNKQQKYEQIHSKFDELQEIQFTKYKGNSTNRNNPTILNSNFDSFINSKQGETNKRKEENAQQQDKQIFKQKTQDIQDGSADENRAYLLNQKISSFLFTDFIDKRIVKLIKMNKNVYQIINFQQHMEKQKLLVAPIEQSSQTKISSKKAIWIPDLSNINVQVKKTNPAHLRQFQRRSSTSVQGLKFNEQNRLKKYVSKFYDLKKKAMQSDELNTKLELTASSLLNQENGQSKTMRNELSKFQQRQKSQSYQLRSNDNDDEGEITFQEIDEKQKWNFTDENTTQNNIKMSLSQYYNIQKDSFNKFQDINKQITISSSQQLQKQISKKLKFQLSNEF